MKENFDFFDLPTGKGFFKGITVNRVVALESNRYSIKREPTITSIIYQIDLGCYNENELTLWKRVLLQEAPYYDWIQIFKYKL